jgi:hypothetical protein
VGSKIECVAVLNIPNIRFMVQSAPDTVEHDLGYECKKAGAWRFHNTSLSLVTNSLAGIYVLDNIESISL